MQGEKRFARDKIDLVLAERFCKEDERKVMVTFEKSSFMTMLGKIQAVQLNPSIASNPPPFHAKVKVKVKATLPYPSDI